MQPRTRGSKNSRAGKVNTSRNLLPSIKEDDNEQLEQITGESNSGDQSPISAMVGFNNASGAKYGTSDKLAEIQSRQMVDYEDLIYREEEFKVRQNPVFNGIEVRQDQFFKYENLRVTELKRALKTEEVQKNKELRLALEKEINGYTKKEMTKEEIEKEKKLLETMHNLDFMMEDGELM